MALVGELVDVVALVRVDTSRVVEIDMQLVRYHQRDDYNSQVDRYIGVDNTAVPQVLAGDAAYVALVDDEQHMVHLLPVMKNMVYMPRVWLHWMDEQMATVPLERLVWTQMARRILSVDDPL